MLTPIGRCIYYCLRLHELLLGQNRRKTNMPIKHVCRTLAAAITLSVAASASYAGAIHDASLFTNILSANDDGSTGQVGLGFTANINGTNYTQTYVNNNGNITFDNNLGTYTPSAISGGGFGPIIAPFFSDVDTLSSFSAVVSYGTANLGGYNVFGVNYINVGVFGAQPIFNDLQMSVRGCSDVSHFYLSLPFPSSSIFFYSFTSICSPSF